MKVKRLVSRVWDLEADIQKWLNEVGNITRIIGLNTFPYRKADTTLIDEVQTVTLIFFEEAKPMPLEEVIHETLAH